MYFDQEKFDSSLISAIIAQMGFGYIIVGSGWGGGGVDRYIYSATNYIHMGTHLYTYMITTIRSMFMCILLLR